MKIKFSYIVFILSLAVAGCAAYFSVWGLSQLFAGASISVIIMASILEFGKIISTTALHRYWDKLATGLRIYLTISVAVLMIITSAGIYGFLSNAYQKTANKLELHEGELGVLDGKKKIFSDALEGNNKIIESKNKRIDQLSGLRTTQESRIDAAKSNTKTLRGDINSSNTEIQKLSTEIDVLNTKNSVLNDSINKYQTKALEVKSGSEVAGEVGPLKYVAELTGISMDRVVNYMILLLIFVFDPLAIALVLTTNRIFQIEKEEEDTEKNKEESITHPEMIPLQSGFSDAINEGANEGANIEEEEDLIEPELPTAEELINEELLENEENEENDVVNDAVNDVVNDVVKNEEVYIEPVKIEETKRPEPVKTTGKIELEDIKEVKERRGYSVPIPEPRVNNSVGRIDNNRIIYKKDGNR